LISSVSVGKSTVSMKANPDMRCSRNRRRRRRDHLLSAGKALCSDSRKDAG
jgi:hypothetical protein